jgi:hypothetical protein
MKSISYTSLIVSAILLYWCTATAYNRVLRVQQIDMMPIFHKPKCILTHLDLQQEQNSVDDLNIYYSGIKTTDDLPQQLIVNQDTKIQDEMLKVIQDKQNKQPETVKNQKEILDKKVDKSIMQPKKEINKPVKPQDDDAFSISKIPKKVNTQPNKTPKKNVFDVLE